MRTHERWIWTELIGFDVTQPDHGVQQYLDDAGFVPDVICLLLASPDFVLSHQDRDDEFDLPPDACSRDGHELGRHRQRQVWTNHQLQALIASLQARGVKVFLTVFTRWYGDQHHPEWLGEHPELFMVFRSLGVAHALNALARLSDGTFFEDIWARKLVQTLAYYGFDGWQGADGWGPLNGPIFEVDFSDDMIAQFGEATGLSLPEVVTQPCGHDPEKLTPRADWIWRNARQEWISFWADRWAGFWTKVMDALHAAGKQAVINSAWGRAPFEALYRYGVDYRKIAATGVDGMIVESAAAGLSLDPRPSAADAVRHFDFLSMLMLIRAYVPDLRLIYLHNVHDIVEEWDALRHVPAVLEKEIWSLANVWHTQAPGAASRAAGPGAGVAGPAAHDAAPATCGALRPAADGFLVCLGDGLLAEEWSWLRRRWEFAFGEPPARVVGATLVWSDELMQREVTDFTQTRRPLGHRLLFELMNLGAPVGATVRLEDLAAATGPLLLLNAHLLSEGEWRALEAYDGPVLAIGGQPSPHEGERREVRPGFVVRTFPAPPLPPDIAGLIDSRGYWDHMRQRMPAPTFLQSCARELWEMAMPGVSFPVDQVCLALAELPDGRLRVAVKSKQWLYCKPEIDLGRAIERIDVVSEFPLVRIRPDGSKFAVRIPPRGFVVADITLRQQ
ncbi:hypothetical protein LLH23_07960 [bacterium]|nr:hypothetical protein [bacterium]